MISVGVDIGSYSIKLAEVESTSKSYIVRRIHEIPFSQSLTQDRKIEIIDALRNLFVSYDLNNTQFIFAVPQELVSIRYRQFSFRERYKILKTVPFELEDDIPFSQEDSVFEAKIVRYAGRGADVLAMACPKQTIREVLNLAHDCGIEPMLISAESLALGNLFERWYDAPPEGIAATEEIPAAKPAQVVVDIGHQTSKVMVYSESALISIRNLDWGTFHMAQALAQKYGLNPLQGLKELQSKGFILLDKSSASKDQVAFSNVIEASLSELVRQMKLKLLEVQSEFNLTWERGSLVGGGSMLRNISGFLTQKFEFPFNRYKQFEHHPVVGFDPHPQLEAITGVAVGLAIEGLRRPKNPAVNFLRGEFERQSQTLQAMWEKWNYAAKCVGVLFLIFFVYAMFRDSFAISMADQSREVLKNQAQAIAGLKGRDASPTRIRNFIKLNKQEQANRKQGEKVQNINSALDVLNSLSKSLPVRNVKFEVKRLTVDNTRVDILGHVPTQNDVPRIEQALKAMAMNGKVERLPVPQTTANVAFGYRFYVIRMASGG